MPLEVGYRAWPEYRTSNTWASGSTTEQLKVCQCNCVKDILQPEACYYITHILKKYQAKCTECIVVPILLYGTGYTYVGNFFVFLMESYKEDIWIHGMRTWC